MFTVIICDKSVIKDCTSKYMIHLKPLLDNKDYAFCAWNPQGETLGEAVPELKNIISIKKEWRAVVLVDSHTEVLDHEVRNPFDYVGYKRPDKKLSTKEHIQEYRRYVRVSVEQALSNPLMKLSVWLGGSAVRLRPSAPEKGFFDVEPCSERYEETRENFGCTIADFEISLARAYRFDRVYEEYELGGEFFNPPKTVIAIAERSIDTELMQSAAAWQKHTEYDYSNFIEDNMYSNKLRCLVYEIPRVRGLIKESDYFKFLTTVMIIAQNDIQSDMLKFGKVYEVSTLVDEQRIEELCNCYLAKLRLTLKRLDELRYRRTVESKNTIDDAQAQREFESEVSIPVSMDRSFDRETLMCEFDEIGLSKDCPGDEETYWTSQHAKIRKRFNRFLRQPQRCVEKAVDHEFRYQEQIDVEKAKRLTKYQREDVLFKLYEEEQNMLETVTSKIFDKAEYERKLDNANKHILHEISERMLKRRTIIAGIIPLILFLIGFLPLFFSELNHFGTISMSFLLTSIALAGVAVCIVIMLFVFRNKMIEGFKSFNSTMSGIYSQIMDSLKQFSKYWGHAANVMKEFAVLNANEDKNHNLLKIYHKHEIDIERNMSDIMTLFSDYVDDKYMINGDIEPYKYDFDRSITYNYDIPYHQNLTEIGFLQPGNSVAVPIDFIKNIKLRREELYD